MSCENCKPLDNKFCKSWQGFDRHEEQFRKEVEVNGRVGRALLEGVRTIGFLNRATALGVRKYWSDKDYLTASGYGTAMLLTPVIDLAAGIVVTAYAVEGSLITKVSHVCKQKSRLSAQ